MEKYGFDFTLTGDAAQKLKDLGVQFQQVNSEGGKTRDLIGNFGSMFSGFTLAGLAQQGITSLFSGLKSEIMDTEKASIDFQKQQFLLKYQLNLSWAIFFVLQGVIFLY